MDNIQEEITKKCCFLLPFELNGSSVRSVNQCEIWQGTTLKICDTFNIYFILLGSIVFDLNCLKV